MKVGVVEITGLTLVVTLVVNEGFSITLYTDVRLGGNLKTTPNLLGLLL